MDKDLVNRLFEYRDGKLYWKNNRGRIRAGDEAGCVRPDGYMRVRINFVSYYAHRIVFLMHHGYMPQNIDHINGNRSYNRIENLRECTPSQNQKNRKPEASKSGIKGVIWNKDRNSWTVRVTINGKSKYIGSFKDIDLAELVAIEAREKHHGEFVRHTAGGGVQ